MQNPFTRQSGPPSVVGVGIGVLSQPVGCDGGKVTRHLLTGLSPWVHGLAASALRIFSHTSPAASGASSRL